VFFDVGETLVDERRYWREVAALAGVPEHALWAALGVAIERGEDHTAAFGYLGVVRPRELDDVVVYRRDDLYPDALPCLLAMREAGYRVGIAGTSPRRSRRGRTRRTSRSSRWRSCALPHSWRPRVRACHVRMPE